MLQGTESRQTGHVAQAANPSASLSARGWTRYDLAALISLGGAFAFFAWRSWRTWPDILVDFGHELYIPWRITAGEGLYRDMAHLMGPLSQYFNAFLFQVFGVSLSTLIAANLVILAAIVGLLFLLFRRMGTRFSATVVCLFFLMVFAFSQYTVIGNYNYVCPYRHEVTHGLALGLAEIWCLVRFFEMRQSRWIFGAGTCLGLVALTKIEMLIPAAGAAIAAAWCVALSGRWTTTTESEGRSTRQTYGGATRQLALFVASAVLPVALAIAALLPSLGVAGASQATLGVWTFAFDSRLTTNSGFYRGLAGIDQPAANLSLMALSSASIAGLLLAGCLLEAILGRHVRSKWLARALGVAAGIAAVWLLPPQQWQAVSAAILPWLSILLIGTARLLLRRDLDQSRRIPLVIFAIYALLLLPKMALNLSWGHYGFILAMPATLVLLHAAVYSVPAWLSERTHGGRVVRAVAIGLASACGLVQFASWDRIAQSKTLSIGTGGDRFFVDPHFDERTLPTLHTLEFLQQSLQPDETLVVIPEGTTLNYLLRARNPTGFLMFTPWEFDAHGGEGRINDRFQRAPPEYVVLVTMDMTIHGRGNFGNSEYGGALQETIDRDYVLVDGYGSNVNSGQKLFQTAVFRRKIGSQREAAESP